MDEGDKVDRRSRREAHLVKGEAHYLGDSRVEDDGVGLVRFGRASCALGTLRAL